MFATDSIWLNFLLPKPSQLQFRVKIGFCPRAIATLQFTVASREAIGSKSLSNRYGIKDEGRGAFYCRILLIYFSFYYKYKLSAFKEKKLNIFFNLTRNEIIVRINSFFSTRNFL